MRVLIVDDSVVFRSQIKLALESAPDMEVVGVAAHGKIALEKLRQTKVDVVTLDLEMPEMDGIETLKAIRAEKFPVRTIMFSSHTRAGSEKTLEALSFGADDFVTKPTAEGGTLQEVSQRIQNSLVPKIRQFFNGSAEKPSSPNSHSTFSDVLTAGILQRKYVKRELSIFKPSVILIGSSTGGPAALENVFRGLSQPLRCPILLAQHMPPIFTATLAKRIAQITGITAKEGENGEEIQPNCIYVAPGNYHMLLKSINNKVQIALDQGPLINSVRPAVDPLFESAVSVYGSKCMAFILTGMGEDGRVGCEKIKSQGGGVMIQDRESCVVWGMPKAVYDAQAFDRNGNLSEINFLLNQVSH